MEKTIHDMNLSSFEVNEDVYKVVLEKDTSHRFPIPEEKIRSFSCL
jgi:hypothetical protein